MRFIGGTFSSKIVILTQSSTTKDNLKNQLLTMSEEASRIMDMELVEVSTPHPGKTAQLTTFPCHNSSDTSSEAEVSDETSVSTTDVSSPSDETEEERRRREEEESLQLARSLMAEEAMMSYEQHFHILQQSVDQFSEEDRQAWQIALQEEQREQASEIEADEDGNMSYETLLQLGERIGDVKTERWTMIARKEIEKLPLFTYEKVDREAAPTSETIEVDDSEHRCLVCQCEYEHCEQLRRLPCKHCFHQDCVDQWLSEKDHCPYCRQGIVESSDGASCGNTIGGSKVE